MSTYHYQFTPRFFFELKYRHIQKQVKRDKWAKMVSQEECASMIMDFLDKGEPRVLVVFLTAAGQLQPTLDFPSSTKTKAVYFAKRFVSHCTSTGTVTPALQKILFKLQSGM